MKAIAIDPVGCGCTECLTGEYVPLDRATPKQVKKMIKGKLRDHTSEAFEITHVQRDGRRVLSVIRAIYSGYEFTYGEY
jgi:hypothetical protein